MLSVCLYMEQLLVCTKRSVEETWACKCRLESNAKGFNEIKINPNKFQLLFLTRVKLFKKVTHELCKTSGFPVPDVSSTTWKIWWILWKCIKRGIKCFTDLFLSSHILQYVAIIAEQFAMCLSSPKLLQNVLICGWWKTPWCFSSFSIRANELAATCAFLQLSGEYILL